MPGAPYRTPNQTIAAKIESPSGTDAVPTTAANAIAMEEPDAGAVLEVEDTREVRGGLDTGGALPTGGYRQFRSSILLKGSGAGATPPESNPFLRAASLAETITAAAVTGTAQAGAASTITLAAGASATNDIYTGMVIAITSGTGSGQSGVIVAYNGSTKVATVAAPWAVTPNNTSVYSIAANVQYRPGAVLPTISIYRWHHHQDGANSKLEKMIAAAGNAVYRLGARGIAKLEVDFRAQLTASVDGSRPADPVLQTTRAPAWVNAPTYLGGLKISPAEISLDLGAGVQMIDDPNEQFGYGPAGVTGRTMKGELLLPKDTESTLNVLTSWRDGTAYDFSTFWGGVAGNRVAIVLPQAVFTRPQEIDRNGFAYWRLGFEPARTGVRAAITYS